MFARIFLDSGRVEDYANLLPLGKVQIRNVVLICTCANHLTQTSIYPSCSSVLIRHDLGCHNEPYNS
jgi:hypothetical protein